MTKNILYIFDEQSHVQRLLDSFEASQSIIFIVPLTANEDKIFQVEQALQSVAKGRFKRAAFANYLDKKAFEIKDDFVRFIADFPRRQVGTKDLKGYFKYPFAKFSIWWFSLISEKNTLKSDSFHNLVKLLTLQELCEKYKCRKVYLDIKDAKLTGAIKDNASALGVSCKDLKGHRKVAESECIFKTAIFALKYFLVVLGRSFLARCYMGNLSKRKRFLQQCKYLLITYFPYLDEQKLKEVKFVNEYYAPLQRALERKYQHAFAWLAMTVGSSKNNWRKNLVLGRRINENAEPFMFCEEWVGFIDCLKTFLFYVYFSIKYFFCHKWISKNFSYHNLGLNLKIWKLFRDDWHKSFCGYALIEGIIYHFIFKNVFRYLGEGAKVMYFAEMHCWEKALNIASSENGKIKTVGIQHTIVPLRLLMYFYDQMELKDGDYIQTMPKPDYLACTGEIPAKLLINSGWNKERVFPWGALRFQHFRQHLKHTVSWEMRRNRVIIALSIVPEQSAEMLIYTHQAFKATTGLEVFIKSHPDLPLKRLIRTFGIEFDKAPFTFCNTPLQVLLRDAKAVIVSASSASLEAIACGCPVIIPRMANFVDMDPLSGLSDLPIYVESPSEMRNVVEKILSGKESPLSEDQCRELILNYCDLPDSDDDFLRKLEEVNGLVKDT